jgi:hypothetical protein
MRREVKELNMMLCGLELKRLIVVRLMTIK